MKFPRSALSVAVVEGSLFALGGYDGADFLASVEYYNIEKVLDTRGHVLRTTYDSRFLLEKWSDVSERFVFDSGRLGRSDTYELRS